MEGSPTELDPNRPHATTDNFYLFDAEGKLLPSKPHDQFRVLNFEIILSEILELQTLVYRLSLQT